MLSALRAALCGERHLGDAARRGRGLGSCASYPPGARPGEVSVCPGARVGGAAPGAAVRAHRLRGERGSCWSATRITARCARWRGRWRRWGSRLRRRWPTRTLGCWAMEPLDGCRAPAQRALGAGLDDSRAHRATMRAAGCGVCVSEGRGAHAHRACAGRAGAVRPLGSALPVILVCPLRGVSQAGARAGGAVRARDLLEPRPARFSAHRATPPRAEAWSERWLKRVAGLYTKQRPASGTLQARRRAVGTARGVPHRAPAPRAQGDRAVRNGQARAGR